MVKAMSGGIEPATLRRKTFSGHGLELVVSQHGTRILGSMHAFQLRLCRDRGILKGHMYSR